MAFPVMSLRINEMSSAMVEECEKSGRLLPHQIDALRSLCDWFGGPHGNANDIALVCMPTGSGKTGIIACLPYYLASIRKDNQARYLFDKPVLVVAPDLAIRDQLVDELTVLSPTKPFLMRTNIVPSHRLDVLPRAIKIDSTAELKNQQNLESNELVIANVQKFRKREEMREDWTEDLDSNLFRLVIIDEAHHHPAATWRQIIEKFRNSECPVVFLTATPFRTDGQKVLGRQDRDIAYHLSLDAAVKRRIIRRSHFVAVDFVDVPQNAEVYTEEERRSAAILAKVKELLENKRRNFCDVPHMALAICKNTTQAGELLKLWKKLYREESAQCLYSEKPKDQRDIIMGKLKNNEFSLVIIVGMLLEGFDHPPISIAAITYEIKSPVRFVQFVGRAQRIYRLQGSNEPQELRADIVTHNEYKQRPNYDNFTSETFIIGNLI